MNEYYKFIIATVLKVIIVWASYPRLLRLKIEAWRGRDSGAIKLGNFSENIDLKKDVWQQIKFKSTLGSFETGWEINCLCCDFFYRHSQILKLKRARIGAKDICNPGESRKILSCFTPKRLGSHNRYRQMAAMGTDGKKGSML